MPVIWKIFRRTGQDSEGGGGSIRIAKHSCPLKAIGVCIRPKGEANSSSGRADLKISFSCVNFGSPLCHFDVAYILSLDMMCKYKAKGICKILANRRPCMLNFLLAILFDSLFAVRSSLCELCVCVCVCVCVKLGVLRGSVSFESPPAGKRTHAQQTHICIKRSPPPSVCECVQDCWCGTINHGHTSAGLIDHPPFPPSPPALIPASYWGVKASSWEEG